MADNWLAQEVGSESKKLSKKSRKAKLAIGLISFCMCIGVGVALASSKPAGIPKSLNVGIVSTLTLPASNASSTPVVSSASAAVSAVALKASQDEAAYQQALANGDKALAASLLQQAKIDQQNLTQQEQQFNASSAPITVSTPTSTYTPAPTPVAPICAYDSQIGAYTQSLTQAENQYSNDQQASQTSAMPNGGSSYGVSASQHTAAWASALQTDQNNINSAQNTLSYYKSQPGC
jgi:hypothetical protein